MRSGASRTARRRCATFRPRTCWAGWTEDERGRAGIVPLPSTPEQQEQALLGSERVRAALGEPLVGAFLAVRRSDAQWAAERPLEEIISAHLWRY